MLRGLRLAIALGLGVPVLGCGGRAKDETRFAEAAPPEGTPQTAFGAEQPARPASRPTASPPNSEAVDGALQNPSPSNGESRTSPAESADREPEAPNMEGACEPGAGRCNGAFVERCSPDGITWLVVQQCPECNGRSYCQDGFGTFAQCLVAQCCYPQTRCNGQFLQICKADATGFELLQDCGSGALCDSNLGACRTDCRPGELRCEGARLERCNAAATGYELLDVCSSPAFCEASLSSQWGRCLIDECPPGLTRCSGSLLQACNETRDGYTLLQDCGSAALCDAVLGACLPGCRPGETRCNGAQVQQCTADGTGFERLYQCATAALCRSTDRGATCATGCSPGEVRCSGRTLMRCNEGRTAYETVEECAAGCDPSRGVCLEPDAGAAPQSSEQGP